MSEDPSLQRINKKTWNHTKPIMICNVFAFFSASIAFVLSFFEAELAMILFILLTLLWITLSVHYAWELEEKL